MQRLVDEYGALLLVVALLGSVFVVLAVIGLDLGFVNDVLGYIYHYETRGTRGGMNWLVVDHWQRHLGGALASAPIQVLFPQQVSMWYATVFGLHFLTGATIFAFLHYWQRGRLALLGFAAALLFSFDLLQMEPHFRFATSTHRKFSLWIAVLMLWAYLVYVRRGRKHLDLYNIALFLFTLALFIYEQAVLFFLLLPVFAIFEEWRTVTSRPRWRYLMRLALDIVPFGVVVVIYVYLIDILFLSGAVGGGLGVLLREFGSGLMTLLSPLAIVRRAAPAWTGAWLGLTLPITMVLGAFYGVWAWRRPAPPAHALGQTLLIAALLITLNILSVAPSGFAIAGAVRLVYPSAIGTGLLFAGVLLAIQLIRPLRTVGVIAFAVLIPALTASGVTRMFQLQQLYLEREAARETVVFAVQDALPTWDEDLPPPYFVIISDAHAQDDLWLFAQDIFFPYLFDLQYGTEGILADAVFFDIEAPPLESGQHIIAAEDGLISPLRQSERIDPARLVVLYYDSTTQQATVLDAIPDDVLATGNLYAGIPFDWETNDAYLD